MTAPRKWQDAPPREQMNLLNAACGDLSKQIEWHGFRLTLDDWRHMLSGTILGWRLMPGIDRGHGQAGLIMLGGSSLKLYRSECTDAITLAFSIGDDPESQGLKSLPVRWSAAVCGARWLVADENTGEQQ